MQHGRVVCVGVADLDGKQPMALQLDPFDRNGRYSTGLGGILPGKSTSHSWARPTVPCSMHHRDRAVGRIGDRRGKPLQQQVGAEPVISVTMGGVDGRQMLAGLFDPVSGALHLFVSERRVDQYRVALAVDQRRGDRRGDDRAAVGQPLVTLASQPVIDQDLVAEFGHGVFLSGSIVFGLVRCSVNHAHAAPLASAKHSRYGSKWPPSMVTSFLGCSACS